MAVLIHFGGNWTGVALFVLVGAFLVRSHLPRKPRLVEEIPSPEAPVGA
jgi:hypothetical protein